MDVLDRQVAVSVFRVVRVVLPSCVGSSQCTVADGSEVRKHPNVPWAPSDAERPKHVVESARTVEIRSADAHQTPLFLRGTQGKLLASGWWAALPRYISGS